MSPSRSLLAEEHRSTGVDDPLSFRHNVGKGVGPSAKVAIDWLRDLQADNAVHSVTDAVVVHRATGPGVDAVGVIADVSLAAYERGDIQVHEKTLPKSEGKMVDYISSARLLGNPVVLAHRRSERLEQVLAPAILEAPDVDFLAIDGTRHQMWIATGDQAMAILDALPDSFCVADGHHRLQAASALAHAERRLDDFVPAGLYSEKEMAVWAFARGVRKSPLSGTELVERLRSAFVLEETADAVPRPLQRHQFGVRIDAKSYRLTIPHESIVGDVYERLDVNLLQRLILRPLLGIKNPRTDKRLDVTADSGDEAHDPDTYDAWFLPFPTQPSEVMEVADMGLTMPPKSTFFLPKLPGGLAIRPID